MLITSRRAAICQSVAEVLLTGVAPLEAESPRFNFLFNKRDKVSENSCNTAKCSDQLNNYDWIWLRVRHLLKRKMGVSSPHLWPKFFFYVLPCKVILQKQVILLSALKSLLPLRSWLDDTNRNICYYLILETIRRGRICFLCGNNFCHYYYYYYYYYYYCVKHLITSSPGRTLSRTSRVWDFRFVEEPEVWKNRPLSKI